MLGMVLLPDGQTFPVQISTTNEFYHLRCLIPRYLRLAGDVGCSLPSSGRSISHKETLEHRSHPLRPPILDLQGNVAHDRAKSLLARLLPTVESV